MQPTTQNRKDISVVTGTYNRLPFLKLTINSIRDELKGQNYEIIVVDGGSTDGTPAWLAHQKDIVTIIQHNRGKWQGKEIERQSWGYFMNLAFKAAQGKYVCMLSDDCLIVRGAITNGYKLFEEKLKQNENIGAVAFYWRNWPEDKNYRVGLTLGGQMFVNHGLYLRAALESVGYIDEDTYNFYHADGDLCLKMWQQGYSCIDATDSFIEHYSHANMAVRKSNEEKQKEDWARYTKKWSGIFYNPTDDNLGGWIEKEYDDKTQTAKKFGYVSFSNYLILKKIKLIRYIKKVIRYKNTK